MGYKATPITYKACKSPLKADASLIAGMADIGASKRKPDYGKMIQDSYEGEKESYTTPPSTKEDSDKEKDKGQADKAIDPTEKK